MVLRKTQDTLSAKNANKREKNHMLHAAGSNGNIVIVGIRSERLGQIMTKADTQLESAFGSSRPEAVIQ
jgi:hypothetical protein